MFDEVDKSMVGSDRIDDLRMVIRSAKLSGLRTLQLAIKERRLIRGSYVRGTSGCILYWLVGVTSRSELLAYPFPSEAARWAARRVVRHFDNGTLTESEVSAILDQAIAEREPRRIAAASWLRRTHASVPQPNMPV
jgi:hypothetical protein